MCWDFNRPYKTQYITTPRCRPTFYGPNDNYDLRPLISSRCFARCTKPRSRAQQEVLVWGTGSPRREFLPSEDMADACVFLMDLPDDVFGAIVQPENALLLNVGCGEDLTITGWPRQFAMLSDSRAN